MIPFLRKYWLHFSLLTLLIVIVYANSAFNGLVSDDRGISQIPKTVTDEFISFRNLSAFIRNIIIYLTFLIFDAHPLAHRLINYFFHTANTILVFVIFKKLRVEKVALVTALLFAIHPALSEVVVWISGGNYTLFTFFFLLSFYSYLFPGRKSYLLSITFFLLMLLSYNRSIHLSLVFLVYELSLGNIKRNWLKILPFFGLSAIWALIFIFSLPVQQQELEIINERQSQSFNVFQTTPIAITTYLKLLFFPKDLTFLYSHISSGLIFTIFSWLVLIGVVTLEIYYFFKDKFKFFALGLFLAALILYISPVRIAFFMAERYLYTASIGIFALFANYFAKYLLNKKTYKVGIVILGIFVLILSTRTFLRTFDWRDEKSIYSAAFKTDPLDTRSRNIVGSLYFQEGKKEEAKNLFLEATRVNPSSPEGFHNLGNFYADQGLFPEAIALYTKALEKDETFSQSYNSLAKIYYLQGDYPTAFEYIKAAIGFNTKEAGNYVDLGNILLKLDKRAEAKQAFLLALQKDPKNAIAREALKSLESQP